LKHLLTGDDAVDWGALDPVNLFEEA